MTQKKTKFTINYISELNLPNKSAYSIHVMKMCEAFSKLGYKTNLITINSKNLPKIFKNYNVKHKFHILSIFDNFKKLNFFLRIIFALKIILGNFDDKSIYLSRSIIFALLASTMKKNIVLELHHEITGFSKFIYLFLKHLRLIQNLNYIFLHKNLRNYFKIDPKKNIILDDASNINDFKNKRTKKLKNTCIYIGSFFEGKGIEQIFRLAKQNKKINFHIYGEKKYLNQKYKGINVRIFDYVNYSKIPRILSKYKVALMPYQKKIKGRASISLEKYMSPLKMFDYLAAQMIIIASDLDVYKHILKDNFNCKLIKVNDDKLWSKTINSVFDLDTKYKYLKINAYKTAKKYTWDQRCQKIITFTKKF